MSVVIAILQVFFMIFMSANSLQAQVMDTESTECMSCHDATLMVCPNPHCDHPIFLYYTLSPAFVPLSSLNPAIKLLNGKIGCTTCHVPYDPDNHQELSQQRALIPSISDPMLNIDNKRSALCFACHIR
jgi:hypothetical protein